MTILECHEALQFFIDKYIGGYYSSSELDSLLDRGQMALYGDYLPKASTSQRIKDALSPFKATYEITPANSLLGLVTIPSAQKYLNLLDFEIRYAISGRGMTKYVPLENVNEDERAEKLSSQIDSPTVTSPVLEQMGDGSWQLYPKSQYFGKVTFYRRPAKPVFGYSLISGRVISYDSGTSTQLEWKETQHNEILIKALASIGVNLGAGDITQWAEIKSQQNFNNLNHI